MLYYFIIVNIFYMIFLVISIYIYKYIYNQIKNTHILILISKYIYILI
jgi:hypothetical protein